MPWRYQPVWTDYDGDRNYVLVAVYFDDAGHLTKWTEGVPCPCGENIEELTSDLNRMIVDAICWEPVNKDAIKVGMKFVPRVSMADRRVVADYIDANCATIARQPRPLKN